MSGNKDKRVSFPEDEDLERHSPPPDWEPQAEVEGLITEVESFVKALSTITNTERFEGDKTKRAHGNLASYAALSYDPNKNSISFDMRSNKMDLIRSHGLLQALMEKCKDKHTESLASPLADLSKNWQAIIDALQTVIDNEQALKEKRSHMSKSQQVTAPRPVLTRQKRVDYSEETSGHRDGVSTSKLPAYDPNWNEEDSKEGPKKPAK